MHKLAKLSEDERRRLIGDFLDTAFGGLDADTEFAGIMRSMTPELPDNPEAEQVEAWVELAELSQDPDFRGVMRRMAEQHAAERGPGRHPVLRRDSAAMVRDQAGARALAAGIDPASPQADPVVAAVTARCARLRPPRRRRPSAPAADPAGDRERPSQGALPSAARGDQRLASPGEPGAGARLVHRRFARPGGVNCMSLPGQQLLYRLYTRKLRSQLAGGRLPRHVGIVMDGNRRWARAAGLAQPKPRAHVAVPSTSTTCWGGATRSTSTT